MGYVIIKKDNKVIKRHEWIQKLIDFGADILRMEQSATEREATYILYNNCKIKGKRFHWLNQTIEFNNCKFFDCSFLLKNVNLTSNSEFKYCDFEVWDKDVSTIDFSFSQFNHCSLVLSGKNISLTGIKTGKNSGKDITSLTIKADNISINDTGLSTDYPIELNGKKLEINNSLISSESYIKLTYDNLIINDIYLESIGGNISFCHNKMLNDPIIYQTKSSQPTVITDSDIKDDKNQAILALLSILKGYNKHINDQNNNDIQINTERLDDIVAPKIESIDFEIAKLEKKKESIITSINTQKDLLKEEYRNRKIKAIGIKR